MLFIPLLGASSVAAAFLSTRQIGQLWGGFNITQEALNVKAAISSPGCNATESCVAFVNTVVRTPSFRFFLILGLIRFCVAPDSAMLVAARKSWVLVRVSGSAACTSIIWLDWRLLMFAFLPVLRDLHVKSDGQHDHPGADPARRHVAWQYVQLLRSFFLSRTPNSPPIQTITEDVPPTKPTSTPASPPPPPSSRPPPRPRYPKVPPLPPPTPGPARPSVREHSPVSSLGVSSASPSSSPRRSSYTATCRTGISKRKLLPQRT